MRSNALVLFWILAAAASIVAGCDGARSNTDPAAAKPAPPRVTIQEPVASPPIVAAARGQVGKTLVYDPAYRSLSYPGGDIPVGKGVCTDVVIRALRNAGNMDLQKLVHEDMKAHFAAYPALWGLKGPDRNIDHRRVPNLQRFFERKGYSLGVTGQAEDYLPGDIVTCNVGNRPHIMVVSDTHSRDGIPMVIHNIGSGAKEEPLLFQYPLTGHYRVPLSPTDKTSVSMPKMDTSVPLPLPIAGKAGSKTIHVYVALADNRNQGIVPVPAALGNGDDPANNLYWGAMYGVKTWFRQSHDWELTKTVKNPAEGILEQCHFRHSSGNAVLIAMAYRGAEIKQATRAFLADATGSGGADLTVYIGHNGLMNFSIGPDAVKKRKKVTEAVILACKSKEYFLPWLKRAGAKPLILTNGFMAPEAYTLEAILKGWVTGETAERIHERAANAYNKYQKCGMTGARRLFYHE